MNTPRPIALVDGLPATIPFVGPEAIERKREIRFRARLGANESAFGISPEAREAMRAAVDTLPYYNDPENHDLSVALADHHAVRPEEISVGAGIDDLLGLVVRAYVPAGQRVVASLGAYPTFVYHVHGFGGRMLSVPYTDRGYNDLDALVDFSKETDVRVVYLSNPDNPAGTWHSADDLKAFFNAIPEDRLIVLDEAYAEFAPEEAIPDTRIDDPRVIRMRTFSKAHGMAGARVGYAIAHWDVVTTLDKIRLHFAVNRVAQIGALASLGDRAFVSSVVEAVAAGRREYQRLGAEVGLPTLPSATNFVTFDAGTAERANTILDALIEGGVFVRKPGQPPLDRCFRVTVGREEERAFYAERLKAVVTG